MRAYTESAREGISHSQIITKIYGFKLNLTTDYTGLGKIQYLLGQRGLTILDSVYTEKVDLTVLIPKEEESKLIAEITEATNGQTGIKKLPVEAAFLSYENSGSISPKEPSFLL